MGPKRLQFITLSSPKASKKKHIPDVKVHNSFQSWSLCKPGTQSFSRLLGLLAGFCLRMQCRRLPLKVKKRS